MNPKAEALWQELVVSLSQFLSNSFPGTELTDELLTAIVNDGPVEGASDFLIAVGKAYLIGAMDGSRVALTRHAREAKHVLADQD